MDSFLTCAQTKSIFIMDLPNRDWKSLTHWNWHYKSSRDLSLFQKVNKSLLNAVAWINCILSLVTKTKIQCIFNRRLQFFNSQFRFVLTSKILCYCLKSHPRNFCMYLHYQDKYAGCWSTLSWKKLDVFAIILFYTSGEKWVMSIRTFWHSLWFC